MPFFENSGHCPKILDNALFSDVWFFWPKNWHAYSKCKPKSEWYVIFMMSRLELCLSLLKIPIALLKNARIEECKNKRRMQEKCKDKKHIYIYLNA